MSFWSKIFRKAFTERWELAHYKESAAYWESQVKQHEETIKLLEKEMCHWKQMALSFKKYHGG